MAVVALSPVLDLSAAMPLRAILLAHRGADLELDASDVQRVGGLCLQVLIAGHRTWKADGHTLRVVNASEACRDALTLSDATSALGLEE